MSAVVQMGELFRRLDDAARLDMKRDGVSMALWRVLGESGAASAPGDFATLLRLAGQHAVSLPLAEARIASWMLNTVGLQVLAGLVTPALRDQLRIEAQAGRWRVSGLAGRVPWAAQAACIVVLCESGEGPMLACVPAAQCRITPARNLAQESRDTVEFDAVLDAGQVAPAPAGMRMQALLHGALYRAVQMSGALEYALELSLQYARERSQFGRRIGEFQSIQHELARFAGEVAATVAAALSAAGAAKAGGAQTAQWAIAAAKIRACEAAREGALIAHQVHGAIGLTDEHPLHHATLRLWAWREEYGNEVHWAEFLGRRALEAAGADGTGFWEALVDQDIHPDITEQP